MKLLPRQRRLRSMDLCASVATLVLAVVPTVASAQSTADAALTRAMDKAWETRLAHDGLLAATLGSPGPGRPFERADPRALAQRAKDFAALREAVAKIDPDGLTPARSIDLAVLRDELESTTALAESRGALMPGLIYFGFYAQLARQVGALPFGSAADYERYVARLNAVPGYFADNVATLREGIRRGWVLPCAVMDSVETSISGQLLPAKDTVFYAPFRRMPPAIVDTQRDALSRDALAAIDTRVLPAYRDFLSFVQREYRPACRATLGVSPLQGGPEFYAAALRRATTTTLSAQEVHDLGVEGVARTRASIAEVMQEVGFQGDFRAFQAAVRQDRSLYTTDPEQYLRVAAEVAKRVDARLPEFFGKLPRVPFGIAPARGADAAGLSGAYYSPGATDATRSGTVILNTSDVGSRPLFGLAALLLHEGQPGHHLQIMLWQDATDMHPLRKNGLDQFSNFAIREGWGLYAESLGFELGVYRTPYEKLGRYNLEMLRACRLVLDTGIHMFGWSEEKSRALLRENTFFSETEIEAEIKRYIMTPALNTSYMVGELRIKAMRARAEAALGERFSLRAFHDELLSYGAVPLEVLDRAMLAWQERITKVR